MVMTIPGVTALSVGNMIAPIARSRLLNFEALSSRGGIEPTVRGFFSPRARLRLGNLLITSCSHRVQQFIYCVNVLTSRLRFSAFPFRERGWINSKLTGEFSLREAM
jgi:hypothetical protein